MLIDRKILECYHHLMVDVSVIVPIYNMEQYLERCLNSVLSQNFSGNYEVICINDGSTDKSGQILEDYAKRGYKNLIIQEQKNAGLSEARNTGMKLAKGKYVLFVDSDDFIFENAVKDLFECAEKYNSEVVLFNYFKGRNGLNDKKDYIMSCADDRYVQTSFNIETAPPYVYRFIPTMTWPKLYRYDFIEDIKFIKGIKFEDIPFWNSVYTKAKVINYLPKPLYFYTVGRKNAISIDGNEGVFDIFTVNEIARNILKSAGHFEKLKNVYYMRLVRMFVIYIQIVRKDLRKEFVKRIKDFYFDVDYEAYDREDFYPQEKNNMKLIRYIKENDYTTICEKMEQIGLWGKDTPYN